MSVPVDGDSGQPSTVVAPASSAHNADERTPLLSRDSSKTQSQSESPSPSPTSLLSKPPRRTPLPVFQLFIICLFRISEACTYMVIFPFVNQMIEVLGVVDDPKQVGFYAGLVESIFAFAQLLTVFYWGSLSDRIGRKPVLCVGLAACSVSSVCFGFSTTFAGMLISRAISGGLSGNVVVCRAMMGEITDKTNAGVAYSLLPITFAIGTVIASTIGGYLAEPVRRYPATFERFPILAEYPFLLPCLICAALPAIAMLLSVVYLEETHPSLRKSSPPEGGQSISSIKKLTPPLPPSPAPSPTNVTEKPLTILQILSVPRVVPLLINYFFLNVEVIMVISMLPLYLFTSIQNGGLNFSEADIGNAQSMRAVTSIVTQLSLFAPMTDRWGAQRMLKHLMFMYPVAFTILPLLNVYARVASESILNAGVWVGLWLSLFLFGLGNMTYSCSFMLINDVTPSPSSRGALNGIAFAVECVTRAIGPALSNSLFAISIESNVLGGQLVWVISILFSLAGLASTFWTEGKEEDRAEGGDEVAGV